MRPRDQRETSCEVLPPAISAGAYSEAQSSEATCPGSHSRQVAGLGYELDGSVAESTYLSAMLNRLSVHATLKTDAT